jgi:hypothetical protein
VERRAAEVRFGSFGTRRGFGNAFVVRFEHTRRGGEGEPSEDRKRRGGRDGG